ncbi:MAG TPA: hypothetical protein VLA56_11500 [Pseudomonadales bacterium]|nr:hypothetical protein [Pseudomonadales bacterium]
MDRGPALQDIGSTAGNRPRLTRASALVVGRLAGEAVSDGPDYLTAADGIAALRLLSSTSVCATVDVVAVDAELADMTGLGLLQRASVLLPHASRVLLVEDVDAVPRVEDLSTLGIEDAWVAPARVSELLRRIDLERGNLRRMRALNRRLEETRAALQRLETRYRDTRSARDRLAASVRTVLAEDVTGPARKVLEHWWRDYRACVELKESDCPVHRRRTGVDELIDDALARLGPLRPDLGAWAAPRGSALGGSVVVDPTLVLRMLVRLLGGVAELAAADASLRWTANLQAAAALPRQRRLSLRVAPIVAPVAERVDALTDSFARLPDGCLAGLSMDLVVADALARVQGIELRFRLRGAALCVDLCLPVDDPDAAGTVSGGPVVPEVDPTL